MGDCGRQLLTLVTSFNPIPPSFGTHACGHIVALIKYLQIDKSAMGLAIHVRLLPSIVRRTPAGS